MVYFVKRIALICLLMFALPAYACAEQIDPKTYLDMKKKAAFDAIEYTAIRADNSVDYIGRVIEVKGSFGGFCISEASCNVVFTTTDGNTLILNYDAYSLPEGEFACLVKIGEGSICGATDLELVAFTSTFAIKRHQEEADYLQKTAAYTTQSVKQTRDIPSAGNYDPQYYKNLAKSYNSSLTDAQADIIGRSIVGFSNHYRIDPKFVCAVILAESRFNINATSHAGAQGLGQLMPNTARGMGITDAYDPVQNIYGSVRYIKSMLERTGAPKNWEDLTWHNLSLALAAYNAGVGNVKKHGGIPPFKETQIFVKRVTSNYKKLSGII